jgi:hypothetical protein
MDDKTKQLDKADAAVALAVRMLLILCYRMTKLLDNPNLAEHMDRRR